jgi:hypothetical protein
MGTLGRCREEGIMKNKQKMVVACGVAGLLMLAGLWAALRMVRPRPPEPQAATPEQIAEYLASDAFGKGTPDARRRYLREIQVPGSKTPVLALLFHPNVPEDRRRRVLENVLPVIGPVIDQRLEEFDRLPAAEQTARLDALVDQMQAARQGSSGMMSSVERLNLILQYVDPHTRASVRRHVPALLARMKERGVQTAYPF